MTTPVASGPGALSRRTDRGPAQKIRELPDAQYGEAATYRDLQQSAPLAQSQGAEALPAPNPYASQVMPIGAPTQNADVPVTDGAAAGLGAGPEALGLIPQTDQDYSMVFKDIAVLEFMANQPGASWAMRNLVRRMKGNLG